MSPEEPGWWYRPEAGFTAHALAPAAAVYDWAARQRMRRTAPMRSAATVICVGNFTVGGTGKTPMTQRVIAELAAAGVRTAILTRGYGGRLSGPVLVDPAHHTAADVGDEPLLLARAAPTMVARDRRAGARVLTSGPQPPDVIVMDDGMQNPALAKDLTLAVIDAVRGVGNGLVVPAGPLRMDLRRQLEFVDAVVVNGFDPSGEDRVARWFERHTHVPVLRARPVPSGVAGALAGQRVVAFAGIANPSRFELLLADIGADIATFMPFPDHHPFTPSECENLMMVARGASAVLVTTEKDWVRLSGSQSHDLLRATSTAVPITLAFDEKDAGRLSALIGAALSRRKPGTVSAPRGDAP